MKISKHFKLYEVEKSHTATRYNIDNSLPEMYLENAIDVAKNVMDEVRDHFGKPITPSSWYRCPTLNAIKGSRPTSDHTIGCAVDFEIAGISNLEVAKFIRDNLKFKQLILEYYNPKIMNSGWIHVSYLKGHNYNEVKRTSDGKTYHKGLEG